MKDKKMKPWHYTPYTEDDLEEIAEIFKYFALERYTSDGFISDQEMIEQAYWIFELTRCIRHEFNVPDYDHWRKVVFMIPQA